MLTNKINQDALTLLRSEVPDSWVLQWTGPPTPSTWLRHFCRRISALRKWVTAAQEGSLLQKEVNLSELFHPETFLNALRQRNSRQLKCSIDELKLVAAFERRKLGGGAVVLNGLLLQGCSFEGGHMMEQKGENLQELVNLPPVELAWIRNSDPDPYMAGSTVVSQFFCWNDILSTRYVCVDHSSLSCT